MKRSGAHVEQDARLGVLRDRDGQPAVGAAAGRRDDPLGHLALHHHDRARDAAARARVDERQHQRARDLVRQVADDDDRPAGGAARRGVVERERIGARRPRRARRRASSAASTRCMSGSRSTARIAPAARAPPARAPPSASRGPRRSRRRRHRPSRRRPRRCAPARSGRAGSSAPRTSSPPAHAAPAPAADRRSPSSAPGMKRRTPGPPRSLNLRVCPGDLASWRFEFPRAASPDRRTDPARRAPRASSCVPAAAIIAALSVQYLGGGMWSAKPSSAAATASAARRPRFAATPPHTTSARQPLARARAPRLAHQHVDDRGLEARAKIVQLLARAAARGARAASPPRS